MREGAVATGDRVFFFVVLLYGSPLRAPPYAIERAQGCGCSSPHLFLRSSPRKRRSIPGPVPRNDSQRWTPACAGVSGQKEWSTTQKRDTALGAIHVRASARYGINKKLGATGSAAPERGFRKFRQSGQPRRLRGEVGGVAFRRRPADLLNINMHLSLFVNNRDIEFRLISGQVSKSIYFFKEVPAMS